MQSRATQLQPLPEELDSPRAKLVYLYLQTIGEATITDLQRDLAMPKLSILSILASLSEAGLVDDTGSRYSCI